MIIDCFPFFNELDLLEIRLRLLDDIVDRVVLVESTRTFSLNKKKLYYNENKERFKKYNKKITHIIVDSTPALFDKVFIYRIDKIFWRLKNKKSIFLNPHDIDWYQKDMVSKGLKKCKGDDILILSDLDEIPDPRIFNNVNFGSEKKVLELDNFCYFLNYKVYDRYNNNKIKWLGPVIMNHENFRSFHTERSEARNVKKENLNHNLKIIQNAGWHFSYLGGIKKIQYKIRSAAHTELNTKKINTKENIRKMINEGFFIDTKTKRNWRPLAERIEEIFPEKLCSIFYDYPHLIRSKSTT